MKEWTRILEWVANKKDCQIIFPLDPLITTKKKWRENKKEIVSNGHSEKQHLLKTSLPFNNSSNL